MVKIMVNWPQTHYREEPQIALVGSPSDLFVSTVNDMDHLGPDELQASKWPFTHMKRIR